MNKEDILVCECNYPLHHVVVQYDEEDKLVYLSAKLNRLSIWQRIKVLFGCQVEYEEIILSDKHIEVLNRIIKTVEHE